METIGLGILTAPELLTGLSFEEYKTAYKDVGNYRHLQGEELEKALKSDYELINSIKIKKANVKKEA